MNKEAQDILKKNGYFDLPSDYFKFGGVSDIDYRLEDVNEKLVKISKEIKNTANFMHDPNGYSKAIPLNKNPREETLNKISNYNVLSIYATNLSNLKYFKTKSGSGMIYFNNPHQLLKRLELLGGSILAGNNGAMQEFSQLAHLLNQMKVISKKQLNNLIKSYINI